jgi:diaminopimelate epimerase
MRTYYKYNGAGNTFLLFEDFEGDFPLHRISELCSRPPPLEADGLILARRSSIADFQMVYFNRDGSFANLCGNGLRCFVHFLRDLGHLQTLFFIEVGDKVLTVKWNQRKILTFFPPPQVIHWDLPVEGRRVFVVDTGVPHLVSFATDEVDVLQEGMRFRHHPLFAPQGVNVNFVKEGNPLSVRTYERGVEGETLACGTGAVAVAFVANRLGKCATVASVKTGSGALLEIELGEQILLSGPSERVFEEKIEEWTTYQRNT